VHGTNPNAPAIEASGVVQTATFAEKLSAVNRGFRLLLSVAGRADGSMAPVSSPRHRGEYATIPMPSSRAQGTTAGTIEMRREAVRTRGAGTCVLYVPCADAPFNLNGSHGRDGVEAPELRRRNLAEADVLNQSLALHTIASRAAERRWVVAAPEAASWSAPRPR
jgi:hypothetical protein